MEQLLEAHAPAGFLSRVSSLEQGEVARLEGGVGVKRVALEDGRDAFRVAGPRSWGRGELRWDDYDGDVYRTAEDATRAAFRRSAESTDPDSIGGTTRLSRWAALDDGGTEVRVVDFTMDGKPIVSQPGQTGQTRVVTADSLARKNPLLASLQEEVGKPGTNFTQVTPENRKRVQPLVAHYGKMAHPFGACVRDNTKRFGKERAERICAVVKDMARGTTKWRGKAKEELTEEEVVAFTDRLIEAADGDLDGLETMMLAYVAEASAYERSQESPAAARRFTRQAADPGVWPFPPAA